MQKLGWVSGVLVAPSFESLRVYRLGLREKQYLITPSPLKSKKDGCTSPNRHLQMVGGVPVGYPSQHPHPSRKTNVRFGRDPWKPFPTNGRHACFWEGPSSDTHAAMYGQNRWFIPVFIAGFHPSKLVQHVALVHPQYLSFPLSGGLEVWVGVRLTLYKYPGFKSLNTARFCLFLLPGLWLSDDRSPPCKGPRATCPRRPYLPVH